jgi:hypothetical protein
MIGRTCRTLLAALAALSFSSIAYAHDSWISRGAFRGPQNGEWCCGAADCFVVPSSSVKVSGGGYELQTNNVQSNDAQSTSKEVIPYKEALPSADGQYWRCQRPNGTRRCFFAPISAF